MPRVGPAVLAAALAVLVGAPAAALAQPDAAEPPAPAARPLPAAPDGPTPAPAAVPSAPPAAGPPAPPAGLDEVVVSASRTAQRAFDAPAAIQSIDADAIRASGPGLQLSEPLARIPGVTALDRRNWAQDPQLSIRGFGARSTFGIRGLRLLVDGIPATMPDGQGQASSIDLGALERIEVLRGPLAQLHGNAAGGVVQAFTRRGRAPGEVGAEAGFGSYGDRRIGLSASGAPGGVSAALDATRLSTDGWRAHASAERRILGATLETTTAAGTRVTIVAHELDQPRALDPGGLTRAQLETDPRQAAAAAVAQGARKTVAQRQAGVVVEHSPDADRTLSARAYGGERELFQALSVPPAAQVAPTSAGGIVDLDRGYGGLGLQWTQRAQVAGGRLQATVGVEAERLAERRRGFVNVAGTVGALRRDEDDAVSSTDAFGQLAWTRGAFTWIAGLRTSRIAFRVDDAFVAPGNPDDSGRRTYTATNPVAGVTWHAAETLNLYANLGRGFETPTFAELAYRADGASGPNLGLSASRSTHHEIGAKWRPSDAQRLDLALFAADTDDEIVVDANLGGRSTFRNAGRTARRGVELAWTARLAPGWRAQLAASRLEAEFVDGFATPDGPVAAGARLPGVPSRRLWAGLGWSPDPRRGPFAEASVLHTGPIAVDDRNTDAAEASTVTSLRAGWRRDAAGWRLAAWVRADLAAGGPYVGSVIVNEGQRRFFEPAPGRTWFAAASVSRSF
ncbi:MAG TPA: TonB-dependent receptor [Burkholderiaceae bacterium]|nr:TonB-dependent receptor [Burkholderiaceae bacterium]